MAVERLINFFHWGVAMRPTCSGRITLNSAGDGGPYTSRIIPDAGVGSAVLRRQPTGTHPLIANEVSVHFPSGFSTLALSGDDQPIGIKKALRDQRAEAPANC